jgi:hypothetical protein
MTGLNTFFVFNSKNQLSKELEFLIKLKISCKVHLRKNLFAISTTEETANKNYLDLYINCKLIVTF